MRQETRVEFMTRESILKLLSDEEVGRVCTAETKAPLPEGEEYLDLGQLDRGVQRARAQPGEMATVLPKRNLDPQTWAKILSQFS